MSVVDGQRVRAAETNAAFASKQNNNTLLGIQSLNNSAPESGPSIANVQASLNQSISDSSSALTAALDAQNISQALEDSKGQPDGIATLDNNGRIPVDQLAFETQVLLGTWDASTNTPTLDNTDTDVTLADYYIVSAAGTVDFGAGNIEFEIGDWVLWSGSAWVLVPISSQPFNFRQVEDSTTDGPDVEYQIPAKVNNVIFTDSDLESFIGIIQEVAGYPFIITNNTGVTLTIFNESAVPPAENRIVTGTGDDLDLEDGQSIFLIYNNVAERWNIIGGTGSGSGGDFIALRDLTDSIKGQDATFADVDLDLGDWTRYKDSGAVPTDGTGGTPDDEFATTRDDASTQPLIGAVSMQISTDNLFNCQGNGISLDCAVSVANRGKPMEFSFYHNTVGSNYVDGDLRIYFYDVTNSVLLANIGGNDVLGGSGLSKYLFYTNDTTAVVRCIIHCTTTVTDTRVKLFTGFKLTGDIPTANVPIELSQVINLAGSGDFTGGSIRVSKVGKSVTISAISTITHASLSSATSAVGVIPEWARPSLGVANTIINTNVFIKRVIISTDGQISINSFDYSGVGSSTTSSSFSIAYTVPTSAGSVQALAQSAYLETLTATSSVKTPTATETYMNMSGNSIVLRGGRTYDLDGQVKFDNSGSSPAYTSLLIGWFGANGADSGAVPTLLTATSTLQVISNTSVFRTLGPARTDIQSNDIDATTVRVRVLSDTTIYLVPWVRLTTASNARVTAFLTAKEVPQTNVALMSEPNVSIWLDGGNGFGSTATQIRRFVNTRVNTLGSFVTYTDSATNGATFTINVRGLYEVSYDDGHTTTTSSKVYGISVNASSTTTAITALTYAQGRRAAVNVIGVNLANPPVTRTLLLEAGDIVRAHVSSADPNWFGNAATPSFQMKFLGFVK